MLCVNSDTLRSQYFFCVMSLMAQGAHRGRPVAAAPCTPGLRPATSPLRGAFDLSLQASGRAEAASVQNTALSPHPCGLPRPAGNVSAMLRPPASAVSASMVNKLKAGRTDRRSGKRSATRQYTGTVGCPDKAQAAIRVLPRWLFTCCASTPGNAPAADRYSRLQSAPAAISPPRLRRSAS